jgi:hypothetical protein
MLEVWIVVDEWVDATDERFAPPATTTQMVAALKQAIAADSLKSEQVKVQVVEASTLCQDLIGKSSDRTISNSTNNNQEQTLESKDLLLCPLTLNLPATLQFSAQPVYNTCRDVARLRHQVEQQWGQLTGDGNFWLPIVLTAKGPLYAEVIGLKDGRDVGNNVPSYYQPLHLSDALRQQLYQLGWQLLELLTAPPGTYLVQFGFQGQKIYFDRLWPFPGEPAIASFGVQSPDLFSCHWHCLTGLPLFELSIVGGDR